MLEKCDEKTIGVVVYADEMTKIIGNKIVGPEQLLLGLLNKNAGKTAEILNFNGIKHDAVLRLIKERKRKFPGFYDNKTGIYFSYSVDRILKMAEVIAKNLDFENITPELVFLAILADKNVECSQIFINMKIDVIKCQNQVLLNICKSEEDFQNAVSKINYSELFDCNGFDFINNPELGPILNFLTIALGEACMTNCEFIGTEHLLLTLLRDEKSVAAKCLRLNKILRYKIKNKIKSREELSCYNSDVTLPYTKNVKEVLDNVINTMKTLNKHNSLNEQILYALTLNEEYEAAKIMKAFVKDLSKIRSDITYIEEHPEEFKNVKISLIEKIYKFINCEL